MMQNSPNSKPILGSTDVTVILGLRGCGKSTLSRYLSETYARKIVFDRVSEWNEPNHLKCENFGEFRKLYSENFHHDFFTLVFCPRAGTDLELYAMQCGDVLSTVYKVGREGGGGTCLVIEEAQLLAATHSIHPWLFECILTGRHAELAIIANSQRPASLHKALISQATNVFVGQLFEARDMKYLSETFGDEAFLARTLSKGEFLWFRTGLPTTRFRIF